MLADGVFARPVYGRRVLVDDRDVRAVLRVGIVEIAAAEQGNAFGLQKSRPHEFAQDELGGSIAAGD